MLSEGHKTCPREEPHTRSVVLVWGYGSGLGLFAFSCMEALCCQDFPPSAGPLGHSQPGFSAVVCTGRAARLDPSPMAGQGPPSAWCRASAPHCLPWDPGEMGDMLPAGSGLPRNPHPTLPLCLPVSRASGTGLWVQPSIAAMCQQPQHKPAKSKRLFCWGARGGGERAGLMAAALLTISPWLSVLAGRCQPVGEGVAAPVCSAEGTRCHHPRCLWVLGRAAQLGLTIVPTRVWLQPGGVTPPHHPKCCHTKLTAT